MKRILLFIPLLLTACVPLAAPQPAPSALPVSASPILLFSLTPTPLPFNTPTPSPSFTPTYSEPTLFPTLTPILDAVPDPRLDGLYNLILHPTWNTLWLDAQSVETGADGITYYAFVQAWLDRSAGGRVIHSGYLENSPWSLLNFKPRFIWLSDGGSPDLFDNGVKTPESGSLRWFVHPLDTAGDLLNSTVFAYSFLGYRPYPHAIVGQETFAGRPAYILDWSEDAGSTRLFWVDSETGLILRRLIINETQEIQQDMRLNTVVYGVDVSPSIFAPTDLSQLTFEQRPTSQIQTPISNLPSSTPSIITFPPPSFPTSTPFAENVEVGMITILAAQDIFSPLTDENGQIHQVSIQRDGESINLTLGERGPADPFNPNFDLDFAENAANLVATGQTLHMSDLYFEGQYAGVVFNIQTENRFEWEALFDPDTGQLRSLIRYQLVSGGKALQQSTNILVEEWVGEPPQTSSPTSTRNSNPTPPSRPSAPPPRQGLTPPTAT